MKFCHPKNGSRVDRQPGVAAFPRQLQVESNSVPFGRSFAAESQRPAASNFCDRRTNSHRTLLDVKRFRVQHSRNFIDITGRKFGQLTALATEGRNKKGETLWLCQCACKNRVIVSGNQLRSGARKSCGQHFKIHGHASRNGTPEYRCWISIKRRCQVPNHHKFPIYGARGISVCTRWRNSFALFLADMGLKPEPKSMYSIDRINVNGNYEPGNCRWATPKQQRANQRPRNPVELRKAA